MAMNGNKTVLSLFSLLLLALNPVYGKSFATYSFVNEALKVYWLEIDYSGTFYNVDLELRSNGRWAIRAASEARGLPSSLASSYDSATGTISLGELYADFDGDGGYEASYSVDIQLFANGTYAINSATPTNPAAEAEQPPSKNPPGQIGRACFPGLDVVSSWATTGTASVRIVYGPGVHYYRTYKQWFDYDFYIQYASAHLGGWGRAVYMQTGHADGRIFLDGDCDGCDGQEPSGGGLLVWVTNAELPATDYECQLSTAQRPGWSP